MITRLLLALDDSPTSEGATLAALALKRAHRVAIEALVMIDTPWITRAQAVGIGGATYRVHAEETLLRDARAKGAALVDKIGKIDGGTDCSVRLEEGLPRDILAANAMDCDAIVLGREAHFWGEANADISRVVLQLLHNDPRPVLLAPTAPPAGETVLVAVDGSAPASRSLHMLALLGLARDRKVRVMTIDADRIAAEQRLSQAATLLRAHGTAEVETRAIASEDAPSDIILAEADKCRAGMIAIGAYGHTGIKEYLFGSCTQRLLRQAPATLFVHH